MGNFMMAYHLSMLLSMLLHFFSESLILMDWLLEIIFKDFKTLRNFCKSVAFITIFYYYCIIALIDRQLDR